MAMDPDKIEAKLDLVKAGATAVSDTAGGVLFQNMAEVMEFAKLMSLSQTAVPKHLRNNPGACLAVTVQAMEWRSSPFAVANKSYEVNDRIAYESQLIHAVVESRAPLRQRLRVKYEGEGDKRVCIISGHFKGEVDPVEYRSPEFAKIHPKNSPLWKSDPDQQQFYYSVRAFARRYCPDVLLGIYAEDELPENDMRDITPATGIKERLKGGNKTAGFSQDHVAAQIGHSPSQPVPVADTREAVVVEAKAAEPAAEQQMDLSAGDIETEVADKKRAILNADTLDDVKALAAAATDFLKSHKRQDLLGDVLKAASDRERKIGKSAQKVAAE